MATHVIHVRPAPEMASTVPARGGTHIAVRQQQRQEAAVDEALADSFPASDPPAWTPGVARPVPVNPDGVR